jgi:diaminopimelate decarboxylase
LRLWRRCDKGIYLDFLDIGGGFPVRYLLWSGSKYPSGKIDALLKEVLTAYNISENELLKMLNAKKKPSRAELMAVYDLPSFGCDLSSRLNELFTSYGMKFPTLLVEPGRFIVAKSGVLLTTVQAVKEGIGQGSPNWIAVDVGCHTLSDCWTYNWFFECLPINTTKYSQPIQTYHIGGPLCASGDVLGEGRELPPMKRGDVIAFLQVGAYQLEQQTTFNLFCRAGAVLVSMGEHYQIRRREVYDDLLSYDIVPEHLQ